MTVGRSYPQQPFHLPVDQRIFLEQVVLPQPPGMDVELIRLRVPGRDVRLLMDTAEG